MCSVSELVLAAAGDVELGQQQLHRSTAQLMEQSLTGKLASAFRSCECTSLHA